MGRSRLMMLFAALASLATVVALLVALPALVPTLASPRGGEEEKIETPQGEIGIVAPEALKVKKTIAPVPPPSPAELAASLPWPGEPGYRPLDPPPPLPPPARSFRESAEMGRLLFYTKGCITCHSIRGEGGEVGPDLTGVGLRRSFEWLKQLIKDPKSLQPDSIMGIYIRDDWEVEALARFLSLQRMTVTVPPSEYGKVKAEGVPIPYPPPRRPLWRLLEEKQGINLGPPNIPPSPHREGPYQE